jgi:iron complex outermembrane receptor protein
MRQCFLFAVLAWLSTAAALAIEQQPPPKKPALPDLSLEELMNTEITSVAKKEQRVREAAVAVYVITQEDIRRSGATTIAEALRMAPGIDVARIDSNKWAISSRGLNGRFANKLLVLIDGRSVYTPLFSGVHWDVQDLLLEDIERIEVIRGPGATLWGANAVNGVINIISKRAVQTQGGLLVASAGSRERASGGLRYGGSLGEAAHYRVYAKYFDRDGFLDAPGAGLSDDWDAFRAGFRIDRDGRSSNGFTLQGDVYTSNVQGALAVATVVPPFTSLLTDASDLSGGNLLGRYKRTFSGGSDMTLQLYYDRTAREDKVHHETRNTFDLDFQHHFKPATAHDVIWGLAARSTGDTIDGSSVLGFDPRKRRDTLWSGFVQDEIALRGEELRLTVGSKFEHNDYTGFEIQPNARLLWTPHERHTLWASASRAVRTPSRFEHDALIHLGVLPPAPPALPLTTVIDLLGSSRFESEELWAFEAGYRVQATSRLFLDAAAFYNTYDKFRSLEPGLPALRTTPLPPHLVVVLRPENTFDAIAYGAEAAATWSPSAHWKLSTSYSWLRVNLKRGAGSQDTLSEGQEHDTPQHQLQLRSYIDLPARLGFDAALYYASSLFNAPPVPRVESRIRADAALTWSPRDAVSLGVVAQNVLEPDRLEVNPGFLVAPAPNPRSFYVKLAWRF